MASNVIALGHIYSLKKFVCAALSSAHFLTLFQNSSENQKKLCGPLVGTSFSDHLVWSKCYNIVSLYGAEYTKETSDGSNIRKFVNPCIIMKLLSRPVIKTSF